MGADEKRTSNPTTVDHTKCDVPCSLVCDLVRREDGLCKTHECKDCGSLWMPQRPSPEAMAAIDAIQTPASIALEGLRAANAALVDVERKLDEAGVPRPSEVQFKDGEEVRHVLDHMHAMRGTGIIREHDSISALVAWSSAGAGCTRTSLSDLRLAEPRSNEALTRDEKPCIHCGTLTLGIGYLNGSTFPACSEICVEMHADGGGGERRWTEQRTQEATPGSRPIATPEELREALVEIGNIMMNDGLDHEWNPKAIVEAVRFLSCRKDPDCVPRPDNPMIANLKGALWSARAHCLNGSEGCESIGLMGEDWCPACRVIHDVELQFAGDAPRVDYPIPARLREAASAIVNRAGEYTDNDAHVAWALIEDLEEALASTDPEHRTDSVMTPKERAKVPEKHGLRTTDSVRPEQPNPSLCGVDPNSDQTPRRHACPDYGRFPCRTCGIPNEEARLARAREADSSEAPICNCYDDGVMPVRGSNCTGGCQGATGYPGGVFVPEKRTNEPMCEHGLPKRAACAKCNNFVLRPQEAPNDEPDLNDPAFLTFQAGHCAGMRGAGKAWDPADCEEAWRDLRKSECRWLAEQRTDNPRPTACDNASMSDRDIAFEAYELAEKLGVPPGTDLSPLREALAQRVDNPRPAEPEWVALAPNKGTDSPAWVDRIESRNPDDRHGQRSESLCDVWPSPDGTSAFENAKRIAAALNGARTDNPEGEAKYALGRLIEYEDDRGNWHPAMITRSSYGSFTFRNLDMLASGSYANADTRVRAMTEERLIEITSAPRVDYPQGTAPDGLFVGALVRNAETGALGIVHAVRLRGASVRVGKRGKTQYWQHPEIVGQVVPPPGAPRSDSVTTPKDGGK